jgi:hypothetical protein
MSSIVISELPKSIQLKIPYSIRTYKDSYELEELPVTVRAIIQKHFEHKKDVNYLTVFDCVPGVSEYGDFTTIGNIRELVLEYLKNYFLTFPEDYPFDPYFGSRLKNYLHMRDTSLQRTFIGNEVSNIVRVISADLGISIKIEDIEITPINRQSHTDYQIVIKTKINDVSTSLTIQ